MNVAEELDLGIDLPMGEKARYFDRDTADGKKARYFARTYKLHAAPAERERAIMLLRNVIQSVVGASTARGYACYWRKVPYLKAVAALAPDPERGIEGNDDLIAVGCRIFIDDRMTELPVPPKEEGTYAPLIDDPMFDAVRPGLQGLRGVG